MSSSSTDRQGVRRGRHLLAVALAALLGVGTGISLPDIGLTAATLTSTGSVAAQVGVRPCSGTFAAHTASLAPLLHWRFDAAGSPAGDVPAPGLLACDTTGAFTLTGALEQGVTSTATAPANGVGTVAAMVEIADATTPGVLLSLGQPDGHRVDLRVDGGLLAVAETPAGGGPAVLLVGAPITPAAQHLVAISRSGANILLWIDGVHVGTAALLGGTNTPLRLSVGAASGTGTASAHAVVDEVLVLGAALTAAQMSALRDADVW